MEVKVLRLEKVGSTTEGGDETHLPRGCTPLTRTLWEETLGRGDPEDGSS